MFVKDNLDKTPFDYAREKNHKTVAEYLSHVQEIAHSKFRYNYARD